MVVIKESEIIMPNTSYKRPVGVVIFDEEKSKVLLVKHNGPRVLRKEGLYGVPGGRPKGWETPAETAIREISEETGLEINPQSLTKLPDIYRGTIQRENRNKNYSIDVFVATEYKGNIRRSGETVPVWASINRLPRRRAQLMPSVIQMVSDGLKITKDN
jgi:ADP-ribose pyrophosphatase YjhB (NUDIX family)